SDRRRALRMEKPVSHYLFRLKEPSSLYSASILTSTRKCGQQISMHRNPLRTARTMTPDVRFTCHSRAGGNLDAWAVFLDSRLRGNDGIGNKRTNGRAEIKLRSSSSALLPPPASGLAIHS